MGLRQDQLNQIIRANATASSDALAASAQHEQQNKMQRAQQDAALAQLIKGKELEQQAVNENFAAADQAAQAAGLRPGKYSVQASATGRSYNPENEDLMRLLGLKSAIADREERATERFSQRAAKEDIPGRSADFLSLEQATKGDKGGIVTDPNYQPKSAGWNQMLPDVVRGPVVSAAEKMGFMEKGSAAEMQALQRLMNTEIKSNSGTAVSAHEQGRNDIANGMKSNNPEMVRRGIQQMKRALEMDTQNLEGSVPSNIKERYRTQGGEYDINRMLGAQPTAAPTTPRVSLKDAPKGMSPEQFRAWKAQNGL